MGFFRGQTTKEEDDGIPITLETDNSDVDKNPGCRTRFESQLQLPSRHNPWFHVTEPCNGRTLDIPKSFAPTSFYACVYKGLATAVAILTLAWGLSIQPSPPFYFAFLSKWGVCFINIYFAFSFLNTVLAARTPQPLETVGYRLRFTWFFGALGTHIAFIAACLYWFLDFQPGKTEVTFVRVSEHGGLLFLVLIDATIVNRIPYRLQHYWGVLLVECLYVVWNVIHGLATDLGNPNRSDNDPETNDDTLYPVLDWEDDWQGALMYSCLTVFILGPILYSIMWSLSNGVCTDRRKYVEDERDQRPTVDDVEEGSVVAND